MIHAWLSSRAGELVEFARDLVAAPSPNPPGDERAVADLLVARLRELGVTEVDVLGRDPARPNVLARVPGRGDGPTLVLSGHMDTKPPGDEAAWSTPPYDPLVRDGVLAGLGAADMKGALAAMVYAAGAVAAAGLRGTLALAFTADEEAGGAYGARWLAEQRLLLGDAAVIGEPSGITRDWEALRLVSRGVAIFEIRLAGTQMHSSISDQLPSVNASVVMGRLMARMDAERASILGYDPHPLAPKGPTFNIGLVARGGVGYGILPGDAAFLSDVRALPGMTQESIEADLRRFLARAAADDPDVRAELSFVHWLPPCEVEPQHAVVRALAAACEEVLGAAPPLAAFPGGTDAPYFQLEAGIPTVPSLGPGLLTRAHAPNESVSLESVVEAASIYALAAGRFLGAQG